MTEPTILRFTATLAKPTNGTKTASGVVFNVPAAVEKKLGTLESAEGAINGHPFRASIEATDGGRRMIRVNAAMLRGCAAGIGDKVQIAMLAPEAPLAVPADLRTAMKASPEAKALWSDMTEIAKRDYVRWVEGTNNPETRARRVRRTVEQLAEGKRRPCCFNAYEYSMSRIDPGYMKKFKPKA